jgi:hypothetical protein
MTSAGRGGEMKKRLSKLEQQGFKQIADMVRAKREEATNHNDETPERVKDDR